MNPSLDDLSIFVAIAQTDGVTAAATKLGLPKSNVSRALARLEEALGVELVHRTTRRSRLSEAGEALLARTAATLSSLSEAIAAPEQDEEPSGLLRITATVDFAMTVLAEIITRFVARFPKVEVELHTSDAIVDLIGKGIDVAVRFSPHKRLRDSSLVARRVGTLNTVLVASPRYIARRGAPRSPSELGDHDWITYAGTESLILETPERAERHAAHGHIRCNDMLFARAAARAGGGIAVLPTFLADPDIASGELVRVLPRWQMPSGIIWLVFAGSKKLSPKVVAFRDVLVDALKGT